MVWVNDNRSFCGFLEEGVQLHIVSFSTGERLLIYTKGDFVDIEDIRFGFRFMRERERKCE